MGLSVTPTALVGGVAWRTAAHDRPRAWHVTVFKGYSKVAAKLLRARAAARVGRGTHCKAVQGPPEYGLGGAALYIGSSRVLMGCRNVCTVSAADAVGAWACAALHVALCTPWGGHPAGDPCRVPSQGTL